MPVEQRAEALRRVQRPRDERGVVKVVKARASAKARAKATGGRAG
jgi:hypothetical protein